MTINVSDVKCPSGSKGNARARQVLLVSTDQEKTAAVRRVRYVCWLRNSGTMPSSPLESCARSLQHAVLEPSDPASSVRPQGRERGREGRRKRSRRKAERATDRARKRERGGGGGRVGWEECRLWSNPSGRCSADSACQRSLTKADPIFVQCLKVPSEKMSFRVGVKKKKQRRRKMPADCLRYLIRVKV